MPILPFLLALLFVFKVGEDDKKTTVMFFCRLIFYFRFSSLHVSFTLVFFPLLKNWRGLCRGYVNRRLIIINSCSLHEKNNNINSVTRSLTGISEFN